MDDIIFKLDINENIVGSMFIIISNVDPKESERNQ